MVIEQSQKLVPTLSFAEPHPSQQIQIPNLQPLKYAALLNNIKLN